MLERREFLKRLSMMGVVAAAPVAFDLGHSPSQRLPAVQPSDGSFAVSYRHIQPVKRPRKIIIPDVGEYKVLKGDFHIHTYFSDGTIMPKDRVAEAVDNGLDVISITDHIEYRPYFGGDRAGSIRLADKNDDHNIAFDLAKPDADRTGLILVRGTEITKNMPPGHFNAFFLEDANPIAAAVDDWQQMLAIACGQGGFIHWNHPNFPGFQPGDPMRFMPEIEDAYKKGYIHGVEVFNGTTYYPIVSQWCEERDLALIANSDIHISEWDMYGSQNPLRPMTLILAKERSHDSIKEAFFARRTIALAGGMVLGSQEWLKKLFEACVSINSTRPGLLELQNKSDIPCYVKAGGSVRSLPAQGQLSLYRSSNMKTLTVSNWLVRMDKALEIDLE